MTSQPAREGLTARMARWSSRHPWWAIGLWLVFVAAAITAGGTMETRLATSADLGAGESGRGEQLIEQAQLVEPYVEHVVITPRSPATVAAGRSDRAAAAPAPASAAAAQVIDRLRPLPEVAEIGDLVPAPAGDAWLLPVTLAGERSGDAAQVVPVQDAVAEIDGAHPDLHVDLVGDASIGHGINEVINEDLARAGLLSLPVTLAVLLVVFGALLAAGLPLLLAFTAVGAATGLWVLASQLVPDIGTVRQVILLFGLAVAVDYSLFYLKREREERARGRGTVDAVAIAGATSGRAVVVSALTSIVALAGLYLSGDAIFRALGTGVILVVAVAMVGSLTVLPALLVTFGRAMDRPRVPVLWRLTRHSNPDREPRVWRVLLAPALRAPRATVVVTLLLLLAMAAPALGMSLRATSTDDVPRSIPVMQAYDRFTAAFPGQSNAHQIVVRAPASSGEATQNALAELVQRAQDDPRFAVDVAPSVHTSPDGTTSTMAIGTPYEMDDPRAEDSLAALREELLPETVGTVPGAEHAVTGLIAFNADYTSQQVRQLPWVIGVVVLLTVGMMALAFRSVVVALLSGALAAMSVAAAFGVLTLVFQHWWTVAGGHLTDWVPLFLFVVLMGLSMDYHAFVVSRIREAAVAGQRTREAVRTGLLRSAGVVTSVALVMVAVLSIFTTLTLPEMKQLGVGLAAAIAIDATVVRLLLLPAAMTVLGRANWWPARIGR